MNTVASIEQAQKNKVKEINSRIYAPVMKRMSTSEAYETLLQQTIRELKKENSALKDRLKGMEFRLSDYQARILDQASQICALQGIEKTKVVKKRPVGDIVNEVLRDFPGIVWEDIISVRRTKALVKPRHLCMEAVHAQRPDLSLPAIGRIFGGRDHTTVLHAINKIKAERENDE